MKRKRRSGFLAELAIAAILAFARRPSQRHGSPATKHKGKKRNRTPDRHLLPLLGSSGPDRATTENLIPLGHLLFHAGTPEVIHLVVIGRLRRVVCACSLHDRQIARRIRRAGRGRSIGVVDPLVAGYVIDDGVVICECSTGDEHRSDHGCEQFVHFRLL